MSDAQGSNNDPATGDPIEESPAVDETASPASESADPAPVAADDSAPADAAFPATAPAEGTSEPDYAALAAELEEFERRSADPGDALSTPASSAAASDEAGKDPWFEPAKTQTFTASEPETVVAPAVTASEPVIDQPVPASVAPQPIFVQAPEPPRVRGNRGASGLIGLVAAVVFAAIFFLATLLARAIDGTFALADLAPLAVEVATSLGFWVPVVVFWLGFWLLGALVNRARWGTWVTLGFFVGVVSYGGYILGQLFEAPFWMVTAEAGARIVQDSLLAPLALVAFVLGREITIWFGAWAARRGARVSEQNAEAQAEYERTLEAGPQLPSS